MSVVNFEDYRAKVERAHLQAPQPADGLPPARRASELPDPEPIAWLIDEVWPAGELGLLVGDGGAFKSSVAIHLACAVAGGHRVFDTYQCLPRPALIVSAEDHRDVVLMRARAFCAGHGWPASTLQELYILAEGAPTLGDAQWCAHIAAEVERLRPGLIVLDPWAELQGGDENSNTDARPAIKFLRRLAASVGAAVLLVHHAGKSREGGRALDRIRGATALPAAARVIWFFEFTDDGLVVENLKHSRAPKIPSFHLDRDIHTDRRNRAQWLSARLSIRHVVSEHEAHIVAALRMAPNGERSFNDLGRLLQIQRQRLGGVLDDMVKARKLDVRDGPRNARLYRVRDTFEDDRFPLVPTGSRSDEAPRAPRHDDLVPEAFPPPLRGEGFGNQSRGGGADQSESLEMTNADRFPGTSGNQSGNQSDNPPPPTQGPAAERIAPADELLARLEERRAIGGDL